MLRYLLLASLLPLLASACAGGPPAPAAAPEAPAEKAVPLSERPGAVVFDFEVKSAETAAASMGGDVAQAVIEALLRGGRLRPVERKELAKILEEQELAASGLLREEDAVKVGRLAGARYILLGSVSVVESRLRLNARLLDVETAEILMAESVYGEKDRVFELEEALALKLQAGLR